MKERAPRDGSLQRAYDGFKKLHRHWRTSRFRDGLFHYDTAGRDGNWLQEVKDESGWDNAVRFDNCIVELWPVDLNGYMVLFYQAMAWMAACLGEDSDSWSSAGNRLETEIEAALWSPEIQSYCDYDSRRRSFTNVLSPASFLPLFCGTANGQRAARMAELAADPGVFFPGMPTVSYDNPEYSRDMWRGPCWLNTAYFAVMGLKRYGHHEVANQMRETILDWCAAEEELREDYDAKTGEGLAAGGFGWRGAFFFLLSSARG